jgi:CspA family cold shock protein
MATGTVRWFDDSRGFGLIAQDEGGEDVFCHFSVILADGCSKALAEGQKVEFDRYDLPEGLVAGNVRRIFDESGALVTVLCADAVQVRAVAYRRPNLRVFADRLRPFGEVHQSEYLVRLRAPPHELTLFDDGRAIVKGTDDEAVALSLVSKWLGVHLSA